MFIDTIPRIPVRQRGAVLIIGLIFLVVITLIGVTAMQRTTLDTKIVSNYKSYRTAFEAAEAAVQDGECLLIALPLRPRVRVGGTYSRADPKIWTENNSPAAVCTEKKGILDWWFSCGSWEKFSADQVYRLSVPFYGLEDSSTASRPMYLLEREPEGIVQYGDPKMPLDYYRITARSSTGPNSQSNVMIQSVFAWQYRRR